MTVSSTPPLPRRAQVVVVGGGIAGVSAAYHLARAGVEVLLLEKDTIASGATAAAVGIFAPPMRQPFQETVRFYGVEAARDAWTFALRSTASLVELLEQAGVADTTGLDRAGAHVVADADGRDELRAACDALVDAGLPADWIDADEVARRSGSGAFGGGIAMDGPGGLDPVAATRALAELAGGAGAVLVEAAAVRAVERAEGHLLVRVADPGDGPSDGPSDSSADRTVQAEMVVYATHVESRRFSDFLGDEIVPVLGQGLITEPVDELGRGGWSTLRGMNAWRQDEEGRVLLTGWRWDSWDRSYWKARPALDERLQTDVLDWFRATFPAVGDVEPRRRWSGVQGWTADALPLAGPLPGSPRELVIGGFSGAGMAWAFGCGEVVAAIVAGTEPPPGAHLLNPRRHA